MKKSKSKCLVCGINNWVKHGQKLIKCTKCGFIKAKDNFTKEYNNKLYQHDYYFGSEYTNYIEEKSALEKNFNDRINYLKENNLLNRRCNVLEIGSAYGFFLNLVKNECKTATGYDITKEGVSFSKEKLKVNAIYGDFLKYKGKKVDLVCMWDVIEHLPKPELFIKKISGFKSGSTFKLNKKSLFQYILIFLFALFNAYIVLSPVIHHKTWHFYNDHTTYIVHSEYLQNNSFFNVANTKKESWTDNMYLYQKNTLRMGSQFFLGLIKSISKVEHTIQIYPALASFGEFIFIMSIGLLCLSLRKSTTFIFTTLFLTTIAININHWIVILGFFPQIFGISMFVSTIALLAVILKTKLNIGLYITNSIIFAALISTYQEIVPFVALSIFLILVFSFLFSNKKKQIFIFSTSYLFSVLFSPISILFLIKGIINQKDAIVGWDPGKNFFNYYLTIFGQDNYLNPNIVKFILPGFISLLLITLLSIKNIKTSKKFPLILLSLNTVFLSAIIYFRFFVKNPIDYSVGNNWSVYKIVQWSYWIYIVSLSYYYTLFFKNKTPKIFFILFVLMLPSFLINLKKIRYHNSLSAIDGLAQTNQSPLDNYQNLINNTKNNKYIPANLYFHNIHPNLAYLALSIIKGNSRALFLHSNNWNMFVRDEEIYYPSTSNDFYQWIYKLNERASSTDPIYSQAGFDIYPPNSSILHFSEGFSNKMLENNSHYTQLVEKTGEMRLTIPNGHRANISINIESQNEGVLKISTSDNLISETLIFTKDNLSNKFELQNLNPGFYILYATFDNPQNPINFINPKIEDI